MENSKPKKELNPKLKMWREHLNEKGIKGVLKTTHPDYQTIRDEWDIKTGKVPAKVATKVSTKNPEKTSKDVVKIVKSTKKKGL